MDFLAVLQELGASSARFVIVGGVAANLYGSTRVTHYLDLVPALDPSSWPSLVAALYELGALPRIPESREAVEDPERVKRWVEEKGMLALSFRSQDGSAGVDLLVSRSDSIEGLLERATSVEWEGIRFFVASLDDLIAMKSEADRPQDLLDVEVLKGLRERLDP
jgi:predicted nucleotidyltransferase